MNNGKLQAKQEKLKSLHCPSPQSSLFDSRGSSLRSQIPSLCSYSAVLNSDQSARSVVLNPQHSKESATGCSKHNGELAIRSPQNNDESEIRSPQQLFIDVSNELLRRGQCVRFQAPGQSMHPTIKEGETITIAPVALFNIKRGDILLYIVGRKIIAHRVVRIKREKSNSKSHSSANFATQSASDASANSSIRPATPSLAHSSTHSSTRASIHSMALNPRLVFILRGDASPIYDDPVEAQQILGKLVSVERNGRNINLYSRKARMLRIAYFWASCLKRLILRILGKPKEVYDGYDSS